MTSGITDANIRSMLTIQHPGCRFYIDHAQVTSGLYLAGVRPLTAPVEGFQEAVEWNGRLAPLYDFDEKLTRLFGLPRSERLIFALLVDVSGWDALFLRRFQDRVLSVNPELSDHFWLALKVCGVGLEKMSPLDFYHLPCGIRDRYAREGIVACRFPEDGGAAFLLDLERLLFHSVTGD